MPTGFRLVGASRDLAADVIGKQMFRDDHAVDADKGIGPERRRLGEGHANGEIVDLLDLGVLVAGDRDRGGLGHSRIFPVEDHVIGRERLAVMPFDALFQLPDHREAVLGEAVIFLARNFGGQHRNQIAVAVPSRQRLVEDAGAVLVLGSDGEMRVEQGHRLPIEQFQHAAAAGLGRLVGDCGLRPSPPRIGPASCRPSAPSGRPRSSAAQRPAATIGRS